MAKDSNIVHQYFRKQLGEKIQLIRLNPLRLTLTEITVSPEGVPDLHERDVDETIIDHLKADGFSDASPLEFNLYLSGLA